MFKFKTNFKKTAIYLAVVIGFIAAPAARAGFVISGIGAGDGVYDLGDSVAIGDGALSVPHDPLTQYARTQSVAIGKGAGSFTAGFPSTQNLYSTSVGHMAGVNANGVDNVALGRNTGSNFSGHANVSIGLNAGSNMLSHGGNDFNVSIGQFAGEKSQGADNIYMGNRAGQGASGGGNIFLGKGAGMNKAASSAIAIGGDAQAQNFGVAIGPSATATEVNAVALGAMSDAGAKNSGWAGFTVAGKTMSNANQTDVASAGLNVGVVSVGDSKRGIYRQITSVADGAVSSVSSDAINGSQLFATVRALEDADAMAVQYTDNTKTAITLAGVGGTVIKNLKAGDISITSNEAVNGAQLFATNTNVTNLSTNINNGTIGLVQQVGGAPGLGMLTVGALTGGTSINFAGTSGNRVLSGVSNGLLANDAVNLSQLQAAIGGVAPGNYVAYSDVTMATAVLGGQNGTKVTNLTAGNITANSSDAVNGAQLHATNTRVDNLSQNVTNLQNQVNAGGGAAVNAIVYNDATQATATLGGITGTSLTNLAAGSVTATSLDAVNGAQLHKVEQVANNSAQYSNGGTTLELNANGGTGTVINNVGDGDVSSTSNQAVNGSQLYRATQRLDAMDETIHANKLEAREGIAAAMAMATAPMPSEPGKTSWASSMAAFKGQAAIGVSISHRLKAKNAMAVTFGLSGSARSVGVRIGLMGEF